MAKPLHCQQPEGKQVEVGGWRSRDEALAVIEEARERFAGEGG